MSATSADAAAAADGLNRPRWPLATTLLIVLAPFVALLVLRPVLPAWAVVWPDAWALPFVEWINVVVTFLKDQMLFGLFTFRDVT